LTVGIIGHGGEKYTPLVGTVFVFILMMNLIGQIPGFHSPTANFSLTLALGIVVFFYVQYEGIRSKGVGGYFKHFMGPMPALSPLLLPIELIGELVRPFTLGIRLFGNIFGEDVILVVLAGLGMTLLNVPGIPLHFPIVLLAMLTSFVQAMVFSILTCIYLSLATHHEGHGEEHHGEAGDAHAAHAH
jgi:F-type H+-transporting ATPase subunit a